MNTTGTGLRISGLSEAQKMLKKQRELINEIVRDAMAEGVLVIEGEAKRRCPVDTGRLRDSITTAADIEDDGKVVARVGTNVEYAAAVEYGTGVFAENGNGRKTPWSWKGDGKKHGGWHTTTGYAAQPFLRPAYATRKKEALQVVAEHIKRRLRDA